MSLFVEFGAADPNRPVEAAVPIVSETVAAAGNTVASAPGDVGVPGSTTVVTLTAAVDMYVAFGVAPNPAANPRRRLTAGMQRSFVIPNGFKVGWIAG